MTDSDLRPIVLITGGTGNLGHSLGEALDRDYRIFGLDLKAEGADFPVFEADFTSDAAVELALHKFRDAFGSRIASVIHLVAYFDFTGEDNPLYKSVNIEGTRGAFCARCSTSKSSNSSMRALCSCTRLAVPASASTSTSRSNRAGLIRNRKPPLKRWSVRSTNGSLTSFCGWRASTTSTR